MAANPSPGRWEFAPTLPIATYLFTLIAGPWHVRRDSHDGIPLAVYCRRSLAEHLDADAEEILTVTKQCLDRFHQLFDERYPFGKYDQAFVPEFNAGAMENPGLVTFRDDYVFRSAVTDSQRELRATTIAHEMAHMWFGDLVTMRWWDDLWLNESFAEYLGTRVTAEATRFGGAWTTFALRRKAWGYAADQRPSTHPVAPEQVTDAAEALLNFDGISYAKGASVLRQLVAWLGDDAFLAGLNDHFARHRFGNATLADLLASLSAASGRDLGGWAQSWLRTAQVNTLRAEVAVDDRGRYTEVAVAQTAPPTHPVLRPHRIGVGRYAVDGTAESVEIDLDPQVDDGRTVLAGLAGEPAAAVLLPNAGDLTFAKIRLDPASADAVPLLLPRLADPLARALLWGEALDAATDGERPVGAVVELIVGGTAHGDRGDHRRGRADPEPFADRPLPRPGGAAGRPGRARRGLRAVARRRRAGGVAAVGRSARPDRRDHRHRPARRLARRPGRAEGVGGRRRAALGDPGPAGGAGRGRRGRGRGRRRRPTRAPPARSTPPDAGRRCPTRRPSGPRGRSSCPAPSCPTGWSRPPPSVSGNPSRWS